MAIDKSNTTEFAVKERNLGKPINTIIHSQGMQIAKAEKEVLKKAIEGSDVVHIYLPFELGYTTAKLCHEMNVPCTSGFHIVPENITSTIYLKNCKLANGFLWRMYKNALYRYTQHIHCPSLMVAKQLEKHHFNSNLHVISNGFNDVFSVCENEEKPKLFKDKFVIAFIGRFSREKRNDVLIKAIEHSKYKDRIQIIFGGKGPTRKKIMKMSRKLPVYPMFSFFTREQLISLLNFADLYVHTADIEVEGMTCVEAIACGCVPVVSNSPKSATPQFTTHKKSIFKDGDYKDLAKKIDWWIEHPDVLAKEKKVVAKHSQKFTLENSMKYYVEMFEQAIQDWDKNFDGKSKTAPKPKIINNYK